LHLKTDNADYTHTTEEFQWNSVKLGRP